MITNKYYITYYLFIYLCFLINSNVICVPNTNVFEFEKLFEKLLWCLFFKKHNSKNINKMFPVPSSFLYENIKMFVSNTCEANSSELRLNNSCHLVTIQLKTFATNYSIVYFVNKVIILSVKI